MARDDLEVRGAMAMTVERAGDQGHSMRRLARILVKVAGPLTFVSATLVLAIPDCEEAAHAERETRPPFPQLVPRLNSYLVPAHAAGPSQHDRWTPTAVEASAFEADLALMDAEVAEFGRQYVGSYWKGHKALRIIFFSPIYFDDDSWRYEAYLGSTNTLSLRIANYDLETGDLLLPWDTGDKPKARIGKRGLRAAD